MSRPFPLILAAVLPILFFDHGAAGQNAMTDAEKKQTVYEMYAGYKKDFPAVTDISPVDAAVLLREGRVVFVDTRKPEEMAVSALPGAVARTQFENHFDDYKDRTAVAYCTVSYRSGVFAREMAEKGVTVRNLAGGILAWTLEGGKVYDPNGVETKRVHVYADRWDYAPAGYETVKFSLWQQLF